MLRCPVASRCAVGGAERELGLRVAAPTTIERGAGRFLLGEIDARVVPKVAIAALAAFHRDEGSLASIRRGVLEERARRVVLILAAHERRERANAARLTEAVKQRRTLRNRCAVAITKDRARRRVGRVQRRCILQQLRLKEGQRVLERVGHWARNGPFDGGRIQAVGYELRDQEVDSIFQSTSVVASVGQHQATFGCRDDTLDGRRR